MAEEQKSQNQITKFDQALQTAKNVKELFEIPDVKTRAIAAYSATTGRKDGEHKFQQERYAYLDILHQKPELRGAKMWVHFKVISRVMQNGWSLRDNRIYLQPVKKGDEVVDIKVDPSPAVKREMLELMHNIKRAPEAQIVLVGDVFEYDKLNQRIIKHVQTDKTAKDIKLDNILYSYQRIVWKDGEVTDVVVPHDDLVQAKKKSKIKSNDSGLWVEFPGEACKKTATNRAFRLYHKYPDGTQVILDEEDTKDVEHTEVEDYDAEPTNTEYVNQETGEVYETPQVESEPQAEEIHPTEDVKKKDSKKETKKQQYNLLDD